MPKATQARRNQPRAAQAGPVYESSEEDEPAVPASGRNQRSANVPRKKGNDRASTRERPSYEEDDDFDRTQNAGTSSKDMVSNTVFFLLITNTKRLPIKRTDINKHALKGAKVAPNAFKSLLKKTQKLLKTIFGIRLYGMNESTHEYGLDLSSAGFNSFLLVSDFSPIQLSDRLPSSLNSRHDRAVDSVLFISLSLLFMNSVDPTIGLKEDAIWRFANKLGIDSELGNIKEQDFSKFLKTELVSKHYLTVKETRDEGQEFSIRYFWGPRALLEFSKLDLLLKISTLLNTKPEEFPEQVKAILESSEAQRAKRVFTQMTNTTPPDGDEDGEEVSQPHEDSTAMDPDDGSSSSDGSDQTTGLRSTRHGDNSSDDE